MNGNKKYKKLLNFKIIIFLFSLLVIFIMVLLNISVANPESWPFYDFKRLYEKAQLNLKQSPRAKLNYQYELLDKRLTELVSVVKNKESLYILTTSLRYSTTAGQITELIIQNNLRDEAQKAKEKFETHLLIVKDLPQKYSQNDGEVKFIIDDANYLRVYIDQLSSFLSKK